MRSSARQPHIEQPAAIGAPVMALGIFGAAALQHLPGGAAATGVIAASAAAIWLAIAFSLILSIRRRGISVYTAPAVNSFGLGTWVAATAVVARMMMLASPALAWLARALFFASAAMWLCFLPIALLNFIRLGVSASAKASGVILLATVATQAVAIMALRLFADVSALRWIATALIAVGTLFYAMGLALILRRYASRERWRLVDDWDNSNCILHGALSISGLAAAISGNVSAAALLAVWLAVIVVFIVVEAIELLRLRARVKALGWRAGVFVYDVSQWARNFTFGMFYAFTLAFAERVPDLATIPVARDLRSGIVVWGPYAVLFLLLAETLVMLVSMFPWKR